MSMDDPSREIADLRLDIEALRAVIDATSNGVAAPDALLRACANTLYERYARLARLTADHDTSRVRISAPRLPEALQKAGFSCFQGRRLAH